MKFHHLIIIALAVVVSSCSKEQTSSTEEDIAVSQVSERIVNYVDDNYPDAYIYSAVSCTNSEAKTIVKLNTTEELAFNAQDSYLGSGAQYHVAHQGQGHGHNHGGGHGHGNGNGHCHGFNHGDFDSIPLSSLSPVITTFISTNYPGYQILHAENDSLCSSGAVIEVLVRLAGNAHAKLIFDQSGNYLMSASRIDYTAMPAAVLSSISANYSGYSPRHRSVQFTLSGGAIQYGVFLFNGTNHKRVLLADDGTVICEQ